MLSETLLQSQLLKASLPSNATAASRDNGLPETCISPQARVYGLKELARRAGVTAEFFRTWKIEVGAEETTVHVHPDTGKKVRFKHLGREGWSELKTRIFHTTKASWMCPPPDHLKELVPDFVVPFCAAASIGKQQALFNRVDDGCVECVQDLSLSTLLTLSRFEEMQASQRDAHGRFAGSMSLALSEGVLARPIVDEYGLAFEQALRLLLPRWQPGERRFRVMLSHDIDDIGLPFSLRSACGHAVRRHHPLASVRDLLHPLFGLRPTYLKLVEDVVQMPLARGLRSVVYWKASPPGPHDRGYDLDDPLIRNVINWLRDHDVEMGLHAGYETYLCPDRLLEEAQAFADVLGEWPSGGRQHYLRWCPQTWIDWETCGISYDSSVGYADQIGFRAGTCVPYRPWLLTLNREARLVEIPLLVMDATLIAYLHLSHEQSVARVADCMARSRAVGGVFTLLWHNATLLDPRYNGLYGHFLQGLQEVQTLDSRALDRELY